MPKVTVEYEQHQRDKILQAATACFCRRGYHRTTIQDVCEEAGLSKGGLYTYFQSKEELLAAVVEHSFMGGLDEAMQAVGAEQTAMEKLDLVAATMLSRLTGGEPDPAHSPQLLIEIWAEASKNPQLNALCAAGYVRWRAFLAGLLREGIADGQITPEVNPDELAAILVAMFDGLMVQEGMTKARVDWTRAVATLRHGLLEGILTPRARADGVSLTPSLSLKGRGKGI